MRNAFIVSYDISDPKRLRRVFQTLLGMGDHIQLSVFRCELSEQDRVTLAHRLSKIIHHDEDQVLFINLGPSPGRGDRVISALGRPCESRERTAIVV